MPLYYSNFKKFSNKISRIFWFEQFFCMAFISYTERPISALSSVGEARAGLIWVDFNFVMSQQAPIQWSLNSWAAQANHGHPTPDLLSFLCWTGQCVVRWAWFGWAASQLGAGGMGFPVTSLVRTQPITGLCLPSPLRSRPSWPLQFS